MKNGKDFNQIPERIKDYLTGWKKQHLAEYQWKFGQVDLNELSLDEIYHLYSYAVTKDGALLSRMAS